MNDKPLIQILVVEDSDADLTLVREMFDSIEGIDFKLEHASRLDEAITRLKEQPTDVVLLDLGLPDSKGVETFIHLHHSAPLVPIIVLTGLDDDGAGIQTIQSGAEDFIDKKHVQGQVLRKSVQYAVTRAHARHKHEEEKQRAEQTREIEDIQRLSATSATSVTAAMYSGSPLKESAPIEFQSAVAEYFDLLDVALESRLYKTDSNYSDALRELGLQLGFLRAGPRDVVEIHTAALQQHMEGISAHRARAYMEESRILVLELMGHLTHYYRSFYSASKRRDVKS